MVTISLGKDDMNEPSSDAATWKSSLNTSNSKMYKTLRSKSPQGLCGNTEGDLRMCHSWWAQCLFWQSTNMFAKNVCYMLSHIDTYNKLFHEIQFKQYISFRKLN